RLNYDAQQPRAIVDCAHCFGRVSQQVRNYLLQLDSISGRRRKVVREFGSKNHTVRSRSVDDKIMTSRAASLRSTGSRANSFLLNKARSSKITSEARLPSRRVRRAISRTL